MTIGEGFVSMTMKKTQYDNYDIYKSYKTLIV